MRVALHLIIILSIVSCRNSSMKNNQQPNTSNSLKIEKAVFGTLKNGEDVHEFIMQNSSGIKMSVITYGGIIRTLFLPDNKGQLADVVLGFDDLEGYLNGHPYFGSIIGRYGNRIAKGAFSLEGEAYQLAINNLGNHLHGGEMGFDKVLWTAKAIKETDAVVVEMTYRSKDMEEGYPGNLDVSVTYRLTEGADLIIDYQATTDKKTVVNLTNHAYFNLDPTSKDILGHHLQINAAAYLPVDETLIPLDTETVVGTPFDFRVFKEVGRDITNKDQQLKFGNGFDHCWILNDGGTKLKHAASLVAPGTGRKVEVYTEEPGMQFYSGNFLNGSLTGKEGVVYDFRSGLCLETQHYPDSPNRPDFPSTELNPGEVYSTQTIYRFSVE